MHMNEPPLSTESFLRLGGDCRMQFERFPELGRVFVQTGNTGGGLGKLVEQVSPLWVDGFQHAFDPDAGLGFSLDKFVAIHATSSLPSSNEVRSLDLEFGCYPACLNLIELSGVSEEGMIDRFVGHFGGTRTDRWQLEAWREERHPPHAMCERCAEAAERRARNPRSHPFFGIFEHASACGISLHCRLRSEHVDLTADLTPLKVEALDGFLVVEDVEDRVMLHLNLRMVLGFRIERLWVEGGEIAQLSVFDMHGNLNFEIFSDLVEMAAIWRCLSQTADSLYLAE